MPDSVWETITSLIPLWSPPPTTSSSTTASIPQGLYYYQEHYTMPSQPLHPPSWVTAGTAQQQQSDYQSIIQNMPIYTIDTGPAGAEWNHPPSNQPVFDKEPEEPMTAKKQKNESYNIPIFYTYGIPKIDGEAVGIEIECEGKNLFTNPIAYWSCKSDHSLRSIENHPPCEYVLKKPLNYTDAVKALTYLNSKLKETGSKLQNSSRTSVHVHVNCSTNTIKEITQFICLYIIYESMLVEWCGEERVGNLFCLRVKDAQYFVDLFEKGLQLDNYKSIFNEEYRYMSCNVASIPKFGTVEFRGLKGTVDKDQIVHWINILLRLKERALRYNNPQEIVDHFMRVGPVDFFRETFPCPIMFQNNPELVPSMWEGLRLMRDIAYAIKWKDKLDIPYETPKVKGLVGPWQSNVLYTNTQDLGQYFEWHGSNLYFENGQSFVEITVIDHLDEGPVKYGVIISATSGICWRSYNSTTRQIYNLP